MHQYTLMRHLPTHTDERNFRCNQCGKAFRQMSTLSQHKATHSEVIISDCVYLVSPFSACGDWALHSWGCIIFLYISSIRLSNFPLLWAFTVSLFSLFHISVTLVGMSSCYILLEFRELVNINTILTTDELEGGHYLPLNLLSFSLDSLRASLLSPLLILLSSGTILNAKCWSSLTGLCVFSYEETKTMIYNLPLVECTLQLSSSSLSLCMKAILWLFLCLKVNFGADLAVICLLPNPSNSLGIG